MHSTSIQEEAFYRLRNYPKQIMENIHHAMVIIPRNAALLLHQKPSYISRAIEAFYLRDPISLKPLQTGAPGDLTFPPLDLVTVGIAIPRVGYAQLKSQDFPTPKSWIPSLPPDTDGKAFARAQTGMKIACGMEMLVSDPQNQDKAAVREIKMVLDDIRTGDEPLPSDEDISTWDKREDDEKWLDISFEDLEGELAGRKKARDQPGNFGDQAAQENLQRIVAQFERFLNDDSAGPDGAGLFNESDSGDDDEDEESLNSDDDIDEEGEDKDVSFSDQQLSNMMREMMGMPPADTASANQIATGGEVPQPLMNHSRIEELNSDGEEDSLEDLKAEDIESLSRQIESELKESGALNLDSAPRTVKATIGSSKGKAKEKSKAHTERSQDEEDMEGNDIDINLARNLLQSLKSQAGKAGPGGNLLGMMGMGMPRDEDDVYRTGSWRSKKQ